MNYQKLFNHLSEEHGIILLESEMQEIVNIVNQMNKPQQTMKTPFKCPVCNGKGKVPPGFYPPNYMGLNSVNPSKCKSCNGKGFIIVKQQ